MRILIIIHLAVCICLHPKKTFHAFLDFSGVSRAL